MEECGKVVYFQCCHNCDSHAWCTRHDEAKYQSVFQAVTQAIQVSFPQLAVSLNEVPKSYAPMHKDNNDNKFYDPISKKCVYFPGLGSFQIHYNNILIFSKYESQRWPQPQEIVSLLGQVRDEQENAGNLKKFCMFEIRQDFLQKVAQSDGQSLERGLKQKNGDGLVEILSLAEYQKYREGSQIKKRQFGSQAYNRMFRHVQQQLEEKDLRKMEDLYVDPNIEIGYPGVVSRSSSRCMSPESLNNKLGFTSHASMTYNSGFTEKKTRQDENLAHIINQRETFYNSKKSTKPNSSLTDHYWMYRSKSKNRKGQGSDQAENKNLQKIKDLKNEIKRLTTMNSQKVSEISAMSSHMPLSIQECQQNNYKEVLMKMPEFIKKKGMREEYGQKEMILRLDNIEEENGPLRDDDRNESSSQDKKTPYKIMNEWDRQLEILETRFQKFEQKVQDMKQKKQEFEDGSTLDKNLIEMLRDGGKKAQRNEKEYLVFLKSQEPQQEPKKRRVEDYMNIGPDQRSEKLKKIYGNWKTNIHVQRKADSRKEAKNGGRIDNVNYSLSASDGQNYQEKSPSKYEPFLTGQNKIKMSNPGRSVERRNYQRSVHDGEGVSKMLSTECKQKKYHNNCHHMSNPNLNVKVHKKDNLRTLQKEQTEEDLSATGNEVSRSQQPRTAQQKNQGSDRIKYQSVQRNQRSSVIQQRKAGEYIPSRNTQAKEGHQSGSPKVKDQRYQPGQSYYSSHKESFYKRNSLQNGYKTAQKFVNKDLTKNGCPNSKNHNRFTSQVSNSKSRLRARLNKNTTGPRSKDESGDSIGQDQEADNCDVSQTQSFRPNNRDRSPSEIQKRQKAQQLKGVNSNSQKSLVRKQNGQVLSTQSRQLSKQGTGVKGARQKEESDYKHSRSVSRDDYPKTHSKDTMSKSNDKRLHKAGSIRQSKQPGTNGEQDSDRMTVGNKQGTRHMLRTKNQEKEQKSQSKNSKQNSKSQTKNSLEKHSQRQKLSKTSTQNLKSTGQARQLQGGKKSLKKSKTDNNFYKSKLHSYYDQDYLEVEEESDYQEQDSEDQSNHGLNTDSQKGKLSNNDQRVAQQGKKYTPKDGQNVGVKAVVAKSSVSNKALNVQKTGQAKSIKTKIISTQKSTGNNPRQSNTPNGSKQLRNKTGQVGKSNHKDRIETSVNHMTGKDSNQVVEETDNQVNSSPSEENGSTYEIEGNGCISNSPRSQNDRQGSDYSDKDNNSEQDGDGRIPTQQGPVKHKCKIPKSKNGKHVKTSKQKVSRTNGDLDSSAKNQTGHHSVGSQIGQLNQENKPQRSQVSPPKSSKAHDSKSSRGEDVEEQDVARGKDVFQEDKQSSHLIKDGSQKCEGELKSSGSEGFGQENLGNLKSRKDSAINQNTLNEAKNESRETKTVGIKQGHESQEKQDSPISSGNVQGNDEKEMTDDVKKSPRSKNNQNNNLAGLDKQSVKLQEQALLSQEVYEQNRKSQGDDGSEFQEQSNTGDQALPEKSQPKSFSSQPNPSGQAVNDAVEQAQSDCESIPQKQVENTGAIKAESDLGPDQVGLLPNEADVPTHPQRPQQVTVSRTQEDCLIPTGTLQTKQQKNSMITVYADQQAQKDDIQSPKVNGGTAQRSPDDKQQPELPDEQTIADQKPEKTQLVGQNSSDIQKPTGDDSKGYSTHQVQREVITGKPEAIEFAEQNQSPLNTRANQDLEVTPDQPHQQQMVDQNGKVIQNTSSTAYSGVTNLELEKDGSIMVGSQAAQRKPLDTRKVYNDIGIQHSGVANAYVQTKQPHHKIVSEQQDIKGQSPPMNPSKISEKVRQSQQSYQRKLNMKRATIINNIHFQNSLDRLKVYPKLLEKHQGIPFEDQEFPSLQALKSIPDCGWESLRKVYKGASLFSEDKVCDFTPITLDDNKNTSLSVVFKTLIMRSSQLICRLFESDTVSQNGFYGLWLCHQSVWSPIIVDDFVPVIKNTNVPLYLNTKKQIWPLILEKAIAKACGSYKAYEQLGVAEIFRMLTGSNYVTFKIKEDPSLNSKAIKYTAENENKNFILHCEKHKRDLPNNSMIKVPQVITIQSTRSLIENKDLIQLKIDKNEPFWMKFQVFCQTFKCINLLHLRQNNIFTHIPLELYPNSYTIVEMIVNGSTSAEVSLCHTGSEDQLPKATRIILYREQDKNILKLIGQAKEKNKKLIFFDCQLRKGRYFLFLQGEKSYSNANLMYSGQEKAELRIIENIQNNTMKNKHNEYIPISRESKVRQKERDAPRFLSNVFDMSSNRPRSSCRPNDSQSQLQKIKSQFLEYLASQQ